jgi:hypothetical protein
MAVAVVAGTRPDGVVLVAGQVSIFLEYGRQCG